MSCVSQCDSDHLGRSRLSSLLPEFLFCAVIPRRNSNRALQTQILGCILAYGLVGLSMGQCVQVDGLPMKAERMATGTEPICQSYHGPVQSS